MLDRHLVVVDDDASIKRRRAGGRASAERLKATNALARQAFTQRAPAGFERLRVPLTTESRPLGSPATLQVFSSLAEPHFNKKQPGPRRRQGPLSVSRPAERRSNEVHPADGCRRRGRRGSFGQHADRGLHNYDAFNEGRRPCAPSNSWGTTTTAAGSTAERVPHPQIPLTVRCHLEEHPTLQPTYPQHNGPFARPPVRSRSGSRSQCRGLRKTQPTKHWGPV
jgi:hypothetical protein